MELTHQQKEVLRGALAAQHARPTRQREHVFAVLLAKRDHPTAEELYARAKVDMASISMATVYNCLEALVACNLVRQVNIEREPSRYCPNLAEHAHFHCRDSGRVYDIDIPEALFAQLRAILPTGYDAQSIELSFHGSRSKPN